MNRAKQKTVKKNNNNRGKRTVLMLQAAAAFAHHSSTDIHRGARISSDIASLDSEIEELSTRLTRARAKRAESEARLEGLAAVLTQRI